ncbi:MAG: glycosyltransferase [Candidatus Eisenbacteria bacterium]
MKLGVVSLKLFYLTDGKYVTTGGFGRQMEALASHFDEVVLCVPVARGTPVGAYRIESPNVSYCPLPPYRTQPQLLRAAPVMAWRILRNVGDWDIVNARLPDLTGWLGFAAARLRKIPTFISLTGDWEEVILVRGETNARGAALWALRSYVRFYLALERFAVRRSLTFACGRALYEKYKGIAPRIVMTVWTTVRESEIGEERDTCANDVVRLLFVGRLTRAKGVSYLMEALASLRAEGRSVTLDVVGDGETRAELERQTADLGLTSSVTMHGYKTLGDELIAHYRSADVFVLPSVSEGTPKVVLEAMSNAVPVVATNVGGLPTIVEPEETGLLVEPKSPAALASAIARVIDDGALRRRLIHGGLSFARTQTIERSTEALVSAVKAAHRTGTQ